MIANDADGRVIFELDCPEADTVVVVGDFSGWHDQHIPMTRSDDGRWRLQLDPPPGQYGFRYLINGVFWLLDGSTPSVYSRARDCEVSIVWRPAPDAAERPLAA